MLNYIDSNIFIIIDRNYTFIKVNYNFVNPNRHLGSNASMSYEPKFFKDILIL